MNLFKNYEKNFEDLHKDIIDLGASLAEDYDTVKNQCETIQKTQNEYEREFIALYEKQDEILEKINKIYDILNTPKEDVAEEVPHIKVESVEIADPKKELYYGTKKISEAAKHDYQYTALDTATFTFKYTDKRNRLIHSHFNMFDVLLLMGLENEPTWESWTDLIRMVGVSPNVLKKMIYNIKNGFFDKWDFSDKISFSKEFGLLYVNGKKTNVTIKTARYIVDCITNSNNPMTTLLRLSKGSECSNLMYKLIGTNYKNTQLTSLLFNEVHVPVENNPQKRKEMGM